MIEENSPKPKKRRHLRKSMMIHPNEVIGYSSSLLFLILSFLIYSDILLPGKFPEYRTVLFIILFLYGILRFLVTRSSMNARRRAEKIQRQQEQQASSSKKSI